MFIIDGHSLIYRACFSPAPMLRSADGEPTKGPFIFLKVLMKLAREHQPDYLVVTLDSPRETLRKRLVDPDYKRSRGPGPTDDLKIQLRHSISILRDLRVPHFQVRGYEADDLIASLVSRFARPCSDAMRFVDAYVVTSDKDMHQLVRPGVSCLDVFRNEVWDADAVQRKWGVPPDRVLDVQTLCGDPADGVKGVRGIGPARAAELVQRFGSALTVLRSAGKIASGNYGSRRGAKGLQATTEPQLKAKRQLVALDSNVPLPYTKLEELRFTGFDLELGRPLFNYLGFRQWSTLNSAKHGSTGSTVSAPARSARPTSAPSLGFLSPKAASASASTKPTTLSSS